MPFALLALFGILRHPLLAGLLLSAVLFLGYQAGMQAARAECSSKVGGDAVETRVDSWWPPRVQCTNAAGGETAVLGAGDVLFGWL